MGLTYQYHQLMDLKSKLIRFDCDLWTISLDTSIIADQQKYQNTLSEKQQIIWFCLVEAIMGTGGMSISIISSEPSVSI